MFKKGISAYIGMEHSLTHKIAYLEMASNYGYTLLFTSLHVPEAKAEEILRDFGEFTRVAKKIGYKVIDDISPRALKILGVSGADFGVSRYATDVKAAEAIGTAAGATIIIAPATSRFARALPGAGKKIVVFAFEISLELVHEG